MSGKSNFIVIMGFLGLTLAFIVRILPSPAILRMRTIFDWNETQQGVVLAGFYIGYSLLQITGGRLSYKYGAKYVMLVALLGSGIFNATVPFLSNALLSSGIRLLAGMLQGMYWVSCLNIISKWVSPNNISFAVSVALSGQHLGTAIAQGSYPILAEWYRWDIPFYLILFLILIWSVFWCLFVTSEPKEKEFLSHQESEGGSREAIYIPKVTEIFYYASFWAFLIMTCAYNWTFYLLVSYMPKYLNMIIGMDLKVIGYYTLLAYLGLYVAVICSGRIGDYFITRNYNRTYVRRICVFIGLFPTICAMLYFTMRDNVPQTLIYISTLSITISGIAHGTFMTCPMDLCPQSPGIVGGVANSIGVLPGVIVPIITGSILDRGMCYGAIPGDVPESCICAWNLIFYLTASIAGIGMAMWLFFSSGYPIDFKNAKYVPN